MEKPTRSIRFYKLETEKTKSNRTKPELKKPEKKPSQTGKKPSQIRKPSQNEKTEPNRFEPGFVQKNQTELKLVGLNRFRFGFDFFSI